MREIKFRAWNKYKNEMNRRVAVSGKNVIAIWADDYGQICSRFIDDQNDARYDYIPMQYTGLKDKNGVEIYEGDIVKITQHFAYSNNESFNAIIDFEYFSFNAVLKSKGYETLDKLISLNHEFEVIGNIYENKELLN